MIVETVRSFRGRPRVVAARPAVARTLLASTAAQLFAAADFGPASDALTLTLFAWAETAELETLGAR